MKFKALFTALVLGASCLVVAADAPAASAKPAVPAKPAAPAVQAPTGDPAKAQPISSAPTKAPENGNQRGSNWSMLMPIAIIVIMIFLFSRSNKKQQQKRMEMLDRIVKGTKVLLNSGVYGKVSEVREKEFLVEIADGVKVLVIKNGVASVEDEEKKDGEAK